MVLHDCDTPACFEPSHLYVGTAAQNSADMIQRGRTNGPKGVRNAKCKLSPEDVIRIRELYWEPGRKYGEMANLARSLGITQSVVSNVVAGRIWRHS